MHLALTGVPLPLRFRPDTPMSDDDLLRFCAANDFMRVERDANGEISVMTPAGSRTSKINSRITRMLDAWADEDGRGVTFDSNGGFTLPDGSMRAADAAWVLAGRWEALSAEEQSRYAPLCPDFVIELRSQTDKAAVLHAKMEQWIGNGAQLAWLIDPLERQVTVYRPGQAPEVQANPTSIRGDGIMSGFELDVSRTWD